MDMLSKINTTLFHENIILFFLFIHKTENFIKIFGSLSEIH